VRGLRFGSIFAVALAIVLGGCGSGNAAPQGASGGTPASVDPAHQLYEKLHAGAYQLDSALDSLQQARTLLTNIVSDQGGETKEALLNVLDTLDSAGETLGQYNVSPELSEVQKDTAAAEKRRQHASDEAIDALREIREVRTTLNDMLESGPPKREKEALEGAVDAVGEGLSAVTDGVKLLGGTPPPEENPAPEAG